MELFFKEKQKVFFPAILNFFWDSHWNVFLFHICKEDVKKESSSRSRDCCLQLPLYAEEQRFFLQVCPENYQALHKCSLTQSQNLHTVWWNSCFKSVCESPSLPIKQQCAIQSNSNPATVTILCNWVWPELVCGLLSPKQTALSQTHLWRTEQRQAIVALHKLSSYIILCLNYCSFLRAAYEFICTITLQGSVQALHWRHIMQGLRGA